MASLRTKEVEQNYAAWQAARNGTEMCRLCEKEAFKLFKYWKIIPNDYPYDRIAERHDMVVPLRHTTEDGLTAAEQAELKEIRSTFIADTYVYILEATKDFKSIPAHFHLHLVTLKENG